MKGFSNTLIFWSITIIVIASVFHYPVQIINTLTSETSTSFNVHISIWRILFEPLLGPLLFFNRGLYGINELIYTLHWALIIYISYSIYKFAHTQISSRKTLLLKQLTNTPIIIGLWFALFVITMFMSVYLPANTIINKSPNSILVTSHCHTQFSHDGLIRQERLWKWHKRNNFDAFFITDHNTHDKTIDFVNTQRKGEFPNEPLVMAGEELSGTNHLSLLGLKRKFDTHGFSDSQAIDSVRANNGAVIVNHWFDDKNKTLEYYKNLGVDGFEIENTATEKTYNRELNSEIKTFCKDNNLIMNGGLDFHGYGNVCSLWNAMEIPGWHNLTPAAKEEAILNIIKSRDQSKLKVLLYNDRPYYNNENLFWKPVFTLFNYFRTLNVWQVISWILWILILSSLRIKGVEMAVLGILSAAFLLGLAYNYFNEISNVADSDNDVYYKYSTILFYAGTVLLAYSGIVTFFRFKNNINRRDTGNVKNNL